MVISDPKEIEKLRRSGQMLAEVLALVAEKAVPGISAEELDRLAESEILARGGKPAFKGHQSNPQERPFPASLCVSINEEVVHGIPHKDKILRAGDVVGLDLGVNYQGFFTDAAITVPIGQVNSKLLDLIAAAKHSLANGLNQIKSGNHIGDIGYAIEKTAIDAGFVVVRELVGHGVGRSVWEEPEVPCFGKRGEGLELREGMVLAVEPMLNMKDPRIKFSQDGWTVTTYDGQPAAHFEHTILVTKTGFEVLTKAKL
ncbi:MAG: type I methionyl aminopeptidase [Candidatus Doudnabacteria bacterium]|nr:type I methionyl aminopeptidase [Candidatus Doudnabacteria bacterium]